MTTLLIIIATGYLLGSIPFGYLLVRIFRGEDVRQSGSGNIGATNVSRKSPALGVLTLLLDTSKGLAATIIAASLHSSGDQSRYAVMSLAALFAVVGHMFPVWLKLHGGKGVATGLGSFLLIAPKAVIVAAAIFIAVLALFRYVSLGSVLAVAVFPVFVWIFHEYGGSRLALLFISFASLLIVVKHHGNIRRLLNGTENLFRDSRNQHE